MTDLWTEASLDHEGMAREAALDRVTASLDCIMPFLLAARSEQEFSHRLALAEPRLEAIGISHGVAPEEVSRLAVRQYEILRQALMEGVDPLDELLDSTRFYGQGPEKPDEHDTGPDFSHGYSEVPQGAPGGPVPQVVTPRFPGPEPMIDAQAMRRRASACGLNCGHRSHLGEPCPEEGCRCQHRRGEEGGGPGRHARTIGHEPDQDHPGYSRPKKKGSKKQGARKRGAADYMAETPPDLGTGPGSQDIGVGSQDANGGTGGPPSVAAGMPGPGHAQSPPAIGRVTSSRDPVRMQVLAVAQSVQATNPWLSQGECLRVARKTVGRYFRHTAADWTPTIMSDAPPAQTGGVGHSSGGESGGGLGDAAKHGLEWKGLRSMAPGGGGGAAAGGAGDAAAADLADVAAAAL